MQVLHKQKCSSTSPPKLFDIQGTSGLLFLWPVATRTLHSHMDRPKPAVLGVSIRLLYWPLWSTKIWPFWLSYQWSAKTVGASWIYLKLSNLGCLHGCTECWRQNRNLFWVWLVKVKNSTPGQTEGFFLPGSASSWRVCSFSAHYLHKQQ